MKIIEVKNLNKKFKVKEKEKGLKGSIKSIFKPKYKTINAVNNISFEVEQGEILAFIGPNGAGKSTTIKMLTGILYPTEGEIKVIGLEPSKQRKQNMVFQSFQKYTLPSGLPHRNQPFSNRISFFWISKE